jgi:hypothetical protein
VVDSVNVLGAVFEPALQSTFRGGQSAAPAATHRVFDASRKVYVAQVPILTTFSTAQIEGLDSLYRLDEAGRLSS